MSGKKRPSELHVRMVIEYSRMNREKSLLVLDKSLLMYFSFLFVGVVGFVTGYFDENFLNVMVILSFGVLAVGIIPYLVTMHKEEKRIKTLIKKYGFGKEEA
ncbi:hypothetical protein HYX10_03390 [Candidatus Woesearchaeota archaeon]|nr:hypothetical protein [Candidatus Woesearchaeota archaeon]